jgi:hypothetical protein
MLQPPPTTTRGTLRQLQAIHGAMLVSIIMYGVVMSEIKPSDPEPLSTAFLTGLAFLSVAIVAIGMYLRSKRITPSMETLRMRPDDPTALGQWRIGEISSVALGEAPALFGMVIFLIGGNVKQAVPFLVASFLVLLVWWPKQP